MGLKIDRFTWAIILGVVVLIAAAIVTVAVSGGRGWQTAEYLNEDTPQAVVHDAFLASTRNEPDVAISHYSSNVLDEEKNQHIRDRFFRYGSDRPARRLRILDVDIDEDNEKAYVRIAVDNYNQGGLFESSTSTHRRTVPLVREDGAWKIDTDDLFY